jgi:hypothetical protein
MIFQVKALLTTFNLALDCVSSQQDFGECIYLLGFREIQSLVDPSLLAE